MKPKKMSFFKRAILIVGVTVIPSLYSLFYLQAYWNPYNSVDKLPIAVVNSDKGAEINGVHKNLGNELVAKLRTTKSLNREFVDAEQAQVGVEGQKYYAVITVPPEFSQDIASASTTDKKTASIVFEANQQHNYIASMLLKSAVNSIEQNLRGTVDKEITAGLTAKLKSVPSNLTTLNNGLNTISGGASSLQNGIGKATDGQRKLTSGAFSLDSGISQVQAGAHQLSAGTGNLPKLTGGINSLDAGLNKISSQFSPSSHAHNPTLYDATQALKSQMTDSNSTTNFHALVAGITNTNTGVPKYIDSSMRVMSVIQGDDTIFSSIYSKFRANPTNPSLQAAIVLVADTHNQMEMKELAPFGITTTVIQAAQAQYTQGGAAGKSYLSLLSQQIAPSTNPRSPTLYDAATGVAAQFSSDTYGGNATLKSGIEQAASGADQLSAATASLGQLQTGAAKLSSALDQLKDGSGQLTSGASNLSSGMDTLKGGSGKLSAGINTADSGVANSITSANNGLKSTDGLDRYAQTPVTMKETDINSVPNYGTAFAPFFLSLSLWVGAIMIFFGIHFDSRKRIKILSINSDYTLVRTFFFLLIGVVQAIVLGFIIQRVLQLKIANPVMYYWSCILFSLVSVSVVQFLIIHVGDLGKLLSIVLLIFQLTSCGGTFPIETVRHSTAH